MEARQKRDERMRRCQEQVIFNFHRLKKLQKIDDGSYIKQIYYLKETLLPTIAKWRGGIIIFWRVNFLHGGIKYGWLDLSKASTNFNDSTFHNSQPITLLGKLPTAPYHWSRNFKFTKQEEPRVTPLSDGRLALIYNGNTHDLLASQNIVFLEYNEAKKSIEVGKNGQSLILYEGRQKNWLPFEPNPNQLLFIQEQIPLHIVKLESKSLFENSYKTKTVIREDKIVDTPWMPELFGNHIRGGSPPIKLTRKNLYISFFHTCHEHLYGLYKTYFMGAITFNASFPYNLVSMSKVPIVRPELYAGTWVFEGLDYVMYPMGSFIDDNEEFIYVSSGWQDLHAVVMKLEVDGLLKSLAKL